MDLEAAFGAVRERYEGWRAAHAESPPLAGYIGYDIVPAMV